MRKNVKTVVVHGFAPKRLIFNEFRCSHPILGANTIKSAKPPKTEGLFSELPTVWQEVKK